MKCKNKVGIRKLQNGYGDGAGQSGFLCGGELPYGVGWAVVCDLEWAESGGGNIASSTAVKAISDQISSGWRPSMSSNSIRSLLQFVTACANINIFDMSKSVESLQA